jgi:hypothetical protein
MAWTRRLHRSVYEYLAIRQSRGKVPLRQNQYGVSAGDRW